MADQISFPSLLRSPTQLDREAMWFLSFASVTSTRLGIPRAIKDRRINFSHLELIDGKVGALVDLAPRT